jgi:3-oxoacyl-(acyl-carrier-protein) synthase
MWKASAVRAPPLTVPYTRAPRAAANSADSTTNTTAPSPKTNPSRSASKGRDASAGLSLFSDSGPMFASPAITTGEIAASVPPAITQALARAGVTAEDVDLVVAHGTGTKINDSVETKAMHTAFGAAAGGLAVTSPKSMTGHMIGAAGAISVMVALLAMRDGVISPTVNLETPDPDCDLDYVPLVARETPVATAVVNAFGFGGQNCVLVLQAP